MALVDSLLTAMVRADGDALVMHVGERPIVVSGAKTIDLSTHGMNLGAMVGMLGQLLSGEALAALKEFGAVEHVLPARDTDRFSVVAARSGDDIWIEIRRRREKHGRAALLPTPSPSVQVADTIPAGLPAAAEEPQPDLPALSREAVGTDDAPSPAPESVEWTGEPADSAAPSLPAAESSAFAAERDALVPGTDVLVTDPGWSTATAESEPVVDGGELSAGSGSAVEYPVPEPTETAPATQLVTSLAAEPYAPPAAATRIAEEAGAEAVVAADPEPAPEAAAVDEAASVAEAVPVEAEPGAIEAVVVAETSLLVLEHAVIAPEAEVMASEAIAPPSDGAPMIAAAAAAPPPAESTVVDFGAATEAASPVFAPPQPVMASAGTPAYPVSVLATATPMETTHQSGSDAGGPPPHSTPPHPSVPPVGAENGTSQPDAPVTRTVRIEVPARASSSRTSGIDRLLRTADGAGASELFLVSQGRPYVRVAGNVRPLENEAPLLATDIEALIADVTPEPSRDAIRRGDPAEWLLEVSDVGRVRCSTFRDHRGPGANFHFAFLRAATADDLQLGAELRRLATEPDGLILVGGLAGSDVSAIVAAFVDILNQQRADYIVTLEPQVRVAHVNRQALVSQREVGNDPVRVVAAARAALREEPDVLVIEGVASGELAQLAIDAATQDRLVIASVDAPSASAAVRRLMDLVPEDQRAAARVQLSRCFRGAVAQLLVRKMTGGRVSLRELMPSTRAVSRLLAEGEMSNLMSHMESGAAGHKSLTESLVEHVRAGVVDVREAVRKAPDADRLFARLKSAAVDLGALEGWN